METGERLIHKHSKNSNWRVQLIRKIENIDIMDSRLEELDFEYSFKIPNDNGVIYVRYDNSYNCWSLNYYNSDLLPSYNELRSFNDFMKAITLSDRVFDMKSNGINTKVADIVNDYHDNSNII